MENNTTINTPGYFRTDGNKVINERHIRWIKKINDCLEVCTKNDGCVVGKDTHQVCKLYTPDSYKKLNSLFE
jgi:hypothetical protein